VCVPGTISTRAGIAGRAPHIAHIEPALIPQRERPDSRNRRRKRSHRQDKPAAPPRNRRTALVRHDHEQGPHHRPHLAPHPAPITVPPRPSLPGSMLLGGSTRPVCNTTPSPMAPSLTAPAQRTPQHAELPNLVRLDVGGRMPAAENSGGIPTSRAGATAVGRGGDCRPQRAHRRIRGSLDSIRSS
jgi:hypothetical protein